MNIKPVENVFFVYKIIILGDSGVGKTCLSVRYCEDHYSANKQVTVGVDFKEKQIAIDEFKIRLNIFDTAGQQSYNSIIKSYYRQVDAVIFAYSITDNKSFHNIKTWLKQFNENTSDRQSIKILVGTKCDDQQNRVISKQDGMKLMQQTGSTFFFETSSKENIQIDVVFEQLARNLLLRTYKRKQKVQTNNKSDLMEMLKAETEKKYKCC